MFVFALTDADLEDDNNNNDDNDNNNNDEDNENSEEDDDDGEDDGNGEDGSDGEDNNNTNNNNEDNIMPLMLKPAASPPRQAPRKEPKGVEKLTNSVSKKLKITTLPFKPYSMVTLDGYNGKALLSKIYRFC